MPPLPLCVVVPRIAAIMSRWPLPSSPRSRCPSPCPCPCPRSLLPSSSILALSHLACLHQASPSQSTQCTLLAIAIVAAGARNSPGEPNVGVSPTCQLCSHVSQPHFPRLNSHIACWMGSRESRFSVPSASRPASMSSPHRSSSMPVLLTSLTWVLASLRLGRRANSTSPGM